jgi:hypothetical protein
MSTSLYQSKVSKLSADIASLRKKIGQEKQEEARKSSELTKIRRSLTKRTSSTKENKANRLLKEIGKIQKSIADLESKIASKTKELHRYERRLEKQRRVQTLQERLSVEFPDYEHPLEEGEDLLYDVFICHASEDKEVFVEPLAELLSEMGFRVWYDTYVLKIGDSLRQSIDKGIANSEYGLVVLSPSFFAKGWPQRELDGLTAREVAGRKKLILPIWYNVDYEDVMRYSPTLADKVALPTQKMGLEEIAEAIAEVLPAHLSEEEEDRLDAEEAERILSDPAEERIPWEALKREITN